MSRRRIVDIKEEQQFSYILYPLNFQLSSLEMVRRTSYRLQLVYAETVSGVFLLDLW